jgi:hypothetical protein
MCTPGKACSSVSVVTISADGSVDPGVAAPVIDGGWIHVSEAIGADGIVYLVGVADGPAAMTSRVTAIGPWGELPGWPIELAGRSSGLAMGPDGRVVVLLGTGEATSGVVALDPTSGVIRRSSPTLELQTIAFGVDCGPPPFASPPLVATSGRVFVAGIEDVPIVALDPSLRLLQGWPYAPPAGTPLIEPCGPEEGLCCQWPPSTPVAAGPDGTLYRTLQRSSPSVGQSIAALDAGARMLPGWPVELRRPDATFGSIVVGDDGTVFALAFEPEGAAGVAGTILAIEPDGRTRYRLTVAEP